MGIEHVDIWSKGEVVNYLKFLCEKGNLKKCNKLKVIKDYAEAYYPICTEKWASRMRAHNVKTSVTGYGAPSSYYWPRCPEDCPKFKETEDFISSLSEEKKVGWILEDKPSTTLKTKDVFIIHGHDEKATLELEKMLREKLPKWKVEWNLRRFVRKGYIVKGEDDMIAIGWRSLVEVDLKSLLTLLLTSPINEVSQ